MKWTENSLFRQKQRTYESSTAIKTRKPIWNTKHTLPATTMGIQSTTATTILRKPNNLNGNKNGKKGNQNLEIKLINIQGLNRIKIVEVEKLI